MITAYDILLILKILVVAVTVLLISSLVALAKGNRRLHGRINLAFFVLTLATLLIFELLIRVVAPESFAQLQADEGVRQSLMVHLCFAIPSALLMPLMLFTGLKGLRRVHLCLACVFSVLWIGTVVTGVFFLPHSG